VKSRALLPLTLALVALVRPAVTGLDSPDDPPTLVVVGTGIFADIGGPHAKSDQMLYHTLQMFHTASRGMKPTSVRFDKDIANFALDLPTVVDGRIEGSHRVPMSYPADARDPDAMRDAAKLVAGQVAGNRQAIVAMDMDLVGLDVVAAKSVADVAAQAANRIRNSLPGANAAYELTLAATGQPVLPHDFHERVDAVETSWNRETRRAAVFMQEMAREFKDRNGPNARVILVGHSAFTDAIDQVPLKEGNERLVDMRVLSSERVRPPRESDPDRTVFIAHVNDLPPTRMGNPLSPTLVGDLKREGTVVTLDGYSYIGWDQKPVVLAADTLKSVSPAAAVVSAMARELEQVPAHSTTYLYKSTFDMTVCRGDTCVGHRGTPADVVDLQSKAIFSGQAGATVTTGVLGSLEREKPKESPVGGISLTKPADLPVRPSEVQRLAVDREGDARLVLELWSGERLRLPPADPAVVAAAVKCVYGEGRGPELSLENGAFEGRNVMSVRYVCGDVARTPLATQMLEADRALGSLAWGQPAGYRRPPIEQYAPYVELALDDPRIERGTLAGRVWLVPSAVRLVRDGSDLVEKDVTQSIRFEFWDPDRSDEYLRGAKIGVRTPAGDYLGARLTSEINARPAQFPELRALASSEVIVGALLWARAAGLALADDVMPFADEAIASARASYQLPAPAEEIVRDNGVYHLVPVEQLRTVTTADLEKPALIFGAEGPTRFLWEDGTESRLGYENGRVVTLTSRRGEVSRVRYSDDGELQAIVGPDGTGVAMIPRSGFWIAAAGVPIDLQTNVVRIPRDARLLVNASPREFLDNSIARWLDAERENQPVAGFVALPPRVLDDRGMPVWVPLALVAALVVAPITWIQRRRIAGAYWRQRLTRPSPTQPLDAVRRLLDIGGARAEAAIVSYVRGAGAYDGREALDVIARSGNPTARAALRALLTDRVRGDDAARLLDGLDPNWRQEPEARVLADGLVSRAGTQQPSPDETFAALGRVRATAAIPSLVGALKEPAERWPAATALSAMGAPAVQPLLALLSEQGDDRRRIAWETLERIPDWTSSADARAAVPGLLAGLQHRYGLIREDCARALGRIGDARALHPLIDALGDSKARVQTAAIVALGNLGDARAIPALRTRHAGPHGILVASALVRLGEREPALLAEVLNGGAPADILRLIDVVVASDSAAFVQSAVLPSLLEKLVWPDDQVRLKAYEAVSALPKRWKETPETLAFAKRILDSRPSNAYVALKEIGPVLIPELVARFDKDGSDVPLYLLLDFETPAALPAFRKRLNGEKAGQMMAALGKRGDVEALDALIAATADDNLVSSASDAIEAILRRRVADVSKAMLTRLGALQDRDWIQYIPYTGPCNFEGETYSHRQDFGRIRQLAKQELARRRKT
jgi:HEAT repeat protein